MCASVPSRDAISLSAALPLTHVICFATLDIYINIDAIYTNIFILQNQKTKTLIHSMRTALSFVLLSLLLRVAIRPIQMAIFILPQDDKPPSARAPLCISIV